MEPEIEVRRIQRRRDGGLRKVVLLSELWQQRHEPEQAGGHDDDQQRRKQPTYAAGIERAQGNSTASADLRDQQGSDQEARRNEEYVDADETTRQRRNPSVVGDDRNDGDRAQPIDVLAVELLYLRHPRMLTPR